MAQRGSRASNACKVPRICATAIPPEDGGSGVELRFHLPNLISYGEGLTALRFATSHPIARYADAGPGDVVVLRNLVNDEEGRIVIPQDRRFRLQVPADALTGPQKRPLLGLGDEVPDPDDPQCPDEFRQAVERHLKTHVPSELRAYRRKREFIKDEDPYRPYDEMPDTLLFQFLFYLHIVTLT